MTIIDRWFQKRSYIIILYHSPDKHNRKIGLQVLIVGGGDGGVAREVAKHPLVETIDQVEIDDRVVEVSKKYLPFMAQGFDSPKLNLHIADGFKFMKEHVQYYDVIITDSSDPIGNYPTARMIVVLI